MTMIHKTQVIHELAEAIQRLARLDADADADAEYLEFAQIIGNLQSAIAALGLKAVSTEENMLLIVSKARGAA